MARPGGTAVGTEMWNRRRGRVRERESAARDRRRAKT